MKRFKTRKTTFPSTTCDWGFSNMCAALCISERSPLYRSDTQWIFLLKSCFLPPLAYCEKKFEGIFLLLGFMSLVYFYICSLKTS